MSAYDRKDHFHQRAKREGFRSRAAYKLLEIQQSQRLLRPGQRVIDLGCWPGGWLQVAGQAVGPSGRVAGVDLAAIDPPIDYENVFALTGDLTQPPVIKELIELLGRRADVLLCDAAPKLTGIKDVDRAAVEELCDAALRVATRVLRPGGGLILKGFPGPEAE